jgi:hypothetical protein
LNYVDEVREVEQWFAQTISGLMISVDVGDAEILDLRI